MGVVWSDSEGCLLARSASFRFYAVSGSSLRAVFNRGCRQLTQTLLDVPGLDKYFMQEKAKGRNDMGNGSVDVVRGT